MTTDLTTANGPSDTDVSPEDDAYLRAESIVKAINAALPKGVKQLPLIPETYKFRKRDRETALVAFHSAFELMGGVSRLHAWGLENPDKFYPLFAKVIQVDQPSAGNNTFVFQTPIPANPLDLVSVNATGQVVHLDAEVTDDELPE